MTLEFITQPGPRERHVRRKYRNPLFADHAGIDSLALNEARQRDATELNHFLRYFRDLVQEAIELKPNSDSEVVLDIKQRLDQCYVHCCALPGDQSEIKTAINKLVEVVMKAVRQGAANDPLALDKLDEEDQARARHNELAEQLFVADLLLPDSPIHAHELAASLLSESATAVAAALELFDAEQLSSLYQEARQLLDTARDQPGVPPQATQRLQQLEAALAEATAGLRLN